jgi:HPt (histidine-containing phosphotransfer) domain-containing protein
MTANAMQGDREKCLAAGMDDYLSKPVRLEDIRNIIERWAETAARSEVRPVTETANGQTQQAPAPVPTPQPSDEAPVDMERILDFTEGSIESLKELVNLYLDQTAGQMEQLEAAVQSGNATEVRRIAHSCAGASATCGMRRLVPLLRELEKQGVEGKLTTATELCANAGKEFETIRIFLADYIAKHSGVPSIV